MIIYLFFSLLMGWLLLALPINPKKKSYAIWVIGLLSIYWGFEFINAPDMEGYMDFYQIISPKISEARESLWMTPAFSFEPGFLYLMSISKSISSDFYFFQFVIFLIDFMLIYYGLSRTTKGSLSLFLMCICFSLYPFLVGAMRQGIVCSLLIFSFNDIINRRYVRTLLIFIFAAFFHFSIIIMAYVPILFWLLFNEDGSGGKFEKALFERPIVPLIVLLVFNLAFLLDINFNNSLGSLINYLELTNASTGREYGISSEEVSSFGIKKVIEMDVCYIFVFLRKWHNRTPIIGPLSIIFLFYFIVSVFFDGIISYRLGLYCRLPYYFLFIFAVYDAFCNKNIQNIRMVSLVFNLYLTALFVLQNIINGSFIFDYNLLSILR